MTHTHRLTAVIEREGNGYVSLCAELDIASQGDSVEEARRNLAEALSLFFESASSAEIDRRLSPHPRPFSLKGRREQLRIASEE